MFPPNRLTPATRAVAAVRAIESSRIVLSNGCRAIYRQELLMRRPDFCAYYICCARRSSIVACNTILITTEKKQLNIESLLTRPKMRSLSKNSWN